MLNKPLLLTIFLLFSTSCLFGYLSYSFYGKAKTASILLEKAIEVNQALESSLKREETACKIVDKINTEYREESIKETTKASEELKKIDSLPAVKKAPTFKSEKYEGNVVDIDGALPADLHSVLQQTYSRVQGKASDDAR